MERGTRECTASNSNGAAHAQGAPTRTREQRTTAAPSPLTTHDVFGCSYHAPRLQVIRLIYELIRHGFYATEELAPMIPSMLILLDGRGDRIRPTDEPSNERYQKKVNNVAAT